MKREDLRWAADLHDIGRIDDGKDSGHGARAADWILANLTADHAETGAFNRDIDHIAELCRWHEPRDQRIPRLSLELMILKDADALDRARLGDLDPGRLRLASAHRLVAPAARLERATNAYEVVTGQEVLVRAQDFLGSDLA